jgi:hypothetical protein
MAQHDFIPVAADDWYQRRRQDDEGEFFRKVADQGPRKGDGGGTRQGVYALTATGKLLGYRNHPDPDVMRKFITDALKAWHKLPAEQRAPQAVQVAERARVDKQFQRELPPGGAVVNVFTRILDNDDGALAVGSCKFPGGDRSAHDHLWLLPDDLRTLLPEAAQAGATFEVPQRLALRIARFHLVDNTRGEPPFWGRAHVQTGKLTATVEKADGDTIHVKLEGHYLLATKAEGKNDRGFDVHLLGHVQGNRATRKLEKFDLVALGDHWGQGPYTRGARPGRSPLGVVFELSDGSSPADRVPPQAAREWQGYERAER